MISSGSTTYPRCELPRILGARPWRSIGVQGASLRDSRRDHRGLWQRILTAEHKRLAFFSRAALQ
jgi:hypothetical protein